MLKPWKKMTKEEKQAFANKKIICGFGLFLFGMIWMYFGANLEGFVSAITVMGLLIILFGLVKKFSV
jgi:apolipoprotein N-acyltransferase